MPSSVHNISVSKLLMQLSIHSTFSEYIHFHRNILLFNLCRPTLSILVCKNKDLEKGSLSEGHGKGMSSHKVPPHIKESNLEIKNREKALQNFWSALRPAANRTSAWACLAASACRILPHVTVWSAPGRWGCRPPRGSRRHRPASWRSSSRCLKG